MSPSGIQFVSGDTAGSLVLWSFGDSNPRKLWTHNHGVDNVVFTTANEVLSISSRILVSHDLLRGESRPVAIPSDGPRPEVMTFVGSRYLLLAHHEDQDRDWRASVLDLRTMDPIAKLHEVIARSDRINYYEDVLDSVARGNEPFPWGPSGILIDAQMVDGHGLLGADFRSGDVLKVTFCTANYCSRQTLDILAVDNASGRIAYVTDSGNLFEHVYGNRLA